MTARCAGLAWLFLVVVSCAELPGSAARVAERSSVGASVTGVVTAATTDLDALSFEGEPFCAAALEAGRLRDERLVVDTDGGLAHALVFVSTGVEPAELPEPVEGVVALEIGSCAFRPRVLGMRLGQTLEMTSDDPVLHQFHPVSRNDRVVSNPMPPQPRPFRLTPRRAEAPFPVRCDVHAWERGFVGVFDHPFFAVTDARGRFALPAVLPPGSYTLTVWHEELGERHVELVVAAGDAAQTIDVAF